MVVVRAVTAINPAGEVSSPKRDLVVEIMPPSNKSRSGAVAVYASAI
jgi:hypothetical protein